jgi:hypothetical protein
MRMSSSLRVLALALFSFLLIGGGTALASYVVSTNSQIGPNTVSGHHPPSGKHANLISGSVNGTDLATGAVTLGKLAPNSVNGSKVVNGSLTGLDLAAPVRLPAGCSSNQVAKWTGSKWACLSPITAINAGAGLTGGGSSGSVNVGVDPTQIQSRVTGTCSGDQALQSVDQVGTVGCGSFWSLTGNAGTDPSTDFVGTTDSQPLNLKVNGARALRLEPASDGTNQSANVIGGIADNAVTPGVFAATIAGGGRSTPSDAATANQVTDDYGAVGGGGQNRAGDNTGTTSDSPFATVGGGAGNRASGTYAAVAGGVGNTASGFAATVAGGEGDLASGINATVGGGGHNTASGVLATVAGGGSDFSPFANTASGTQATVGGGFSNAAAGNRATVPGGESNTAGGADSLAAGTHAQALDDGSFVWGDNSTSSSTTDTGANSFVARASGGVTFYTDAGSSTTDGVNLPAGSGSWSSLSDRHAKAAIRPVSGQSVLRKLRTVPVDTWRYKAQGGGVRHLGPMAQAFYRRFGLGESNRYIDDVDAQGVALAGIKGLDSRVGDQSRRVRLLRSQIRSQRARLARQAGRNRSQDREIARLGREVKRLEHR